MNAASIRNASFATFPICLVLAMLVYTHGAPAKTQAAESSISGAFAVSAAHYDLATSDLTKVNRVWFVLTPSSERGVELRLTASPGTWYPCTKRLSRFVCDLPVPVDLESATRFDVRAQG